MNLLAISLLAPRPARWNYVSPLTWLNFAMVQAHATIETRYVHNTRSKIKIEQELIFALPLRLPFWRPHFLLFRIGKCKSKLDVKYKCKDLVKRKRSRIQIVRRLPRRPSMCTCERSLIRTIALTPGRSRKQPAERNNMMWTSYNHKSVDPIITNLPINTKLRTWIPWPSHFW